MSTKSQSHLLQGSMEFADREKKKTDAQRALRAGQIDRLEWFLEISEAWWHRLEIKVGIDEYRRHLVRAMVLNGGVVEPGILDRYPPPQGKLKVLPGGSYYSPKGICLDGVA